MKDVTIWFIWLIVTIICTLFAGHFSGELKPSRPYFKYYASILLDALLDLRG